MNIIQLYQDFNINYFTEGKYTHSGWVNVDCPFCSSQHPGPHLGFELQTNHYHCWACGFHPLLETISILINLSKKETREIIKQYEGISLIKQHTEKHTETPQILTLPSNLTKLLPQHKKYLESRRFDPERLESVWGLKATNITSVLKNINYKNRILIPFAWNRQIVSFDTRDITGKHLMKYMACPKEFEIIEHKKILYGKQSGWKETGICVEGPTDVWRFGVKSFAVSGIAYRPEQLRIISKTFKRVAVCFDGQEIQAKKQANKLVSELKFRGVDAFRVDIVGDPGDMEQSEADYLVKQLLSK
jgi:DNA primase